ncbi:integrase core domain-containing protein [Spirosoma utsteinense]|uniref:Transposase n=1 Tax=Spirosoma utsteinense TaxID=2585773 RepID=A0ABR6WF51_9BACT|nr:integrase core domain-containing protein [Spirosoma utsteinense]MBC3789250.1 putative transposase [Spirosoma utsteinense]MBC3795180.1 putative transposase [Spirosoma utsteinense]
MAKRTHVHLPDCWIFDRAVIKWQRKTFVIVGIMDLRSRKLLAWELLRPLKPKPTAAVLEKAHLMYGHPPALVVGIDKVFKSPDVQATCNQAEIQPVDIRHGKVSISIFIRSVWRSLEWEGLSWRELPDEPTFRQVVNDWIVFYNSDRPHQALGYAVPDEEWRTVRYKIDQ